MLSTKENMFNREHDWRNFEQNWIGNSRVSALSGNSNTWRSYRYSWAEVTGNYTNSVLAVWVVRKEGGGIVLRRANLKLAAVGELRQQNSKKVRQSRNVSVGCMRWNDKVRWTYSSYILICNYLKSYLRVKSL